jgi:hypothetical protein
MKINKSIVITAVFLLIGQVAGAAVYKSVDEHGNVVYTDDPVGNGEPVALPPLSTVPPPSYKSISGSGADENAATPDAGYQQLEITAPAQDETLRDNTGDVWVKASVTPSLNAAAGDRLQYFLDGQSFGEAVVDEKLLIPNLERGAHTVSVTIVGPSGRDIKRSDEVRFYLHRQSLNFPRGPAPGGGP